MLDIAKMKAECFGWSWDWNFRKLPLAKYFANGGWVTGRGDLCYVRDPANNRKIGCTRDATVDQPLLDAIATTARQAQAKWKQTDVETKADFYKSLAAAIHDLRYDLVMLMATESGKTVTECIEEIAKTVEAIRDNLDNRRLYGKKIVLAVTPFNLPLLFPAIKIIGALKNNCAIVLKPSSKTPFTAVCLTWIIHRCLEQFFGNGNEGELCGLIQIIPGRGQTVGWELVGKLAYDFLDFTGSTTAAQIVGRTAGHRGVSHILGPGGHSRMIVMPDFDTEKAADEIATAWLATSGQRCISLRAVYAHKQIFRQLVTALREKIQNIPVGLPLNPRTIVGPLIDRTVIEHAQKAVETMKKRKSEPEFGGYHLDGYQAYMRAMTASEPDGFCFHFARNSYQGAIDQETKSIYQGNIWLPTLYAKVSENCILMRKEIFAPILVVNEFDHETAVTPAQEGIVDQVISDLRIKAGDRRNYEWFSAFLRAAVLADERGKLTCSVMTRDVRLCQLAETVLNSRVLYFGCGPGHFGISDLEYVSDYYNSDEKKKIASGRNRNICYDIKPGLNKRESAESAEELSRGLRQARKIL